jgi:hypothetical protein
MPKPKKFMKHDSGKPAMDLLPAWPLEFVGSVLGHGAKVYAPGNYKYCKDPSRYVAAMLRHATKHMRGQFVDPDSGYPHLAHLICNGLFALDLYLRGEQDHLTVGNYFALIEKKGKRGVVKKRFKSFERAWAHLEDKKLDHDKYMVQSVPYHDKVGSTVRL